MSFMPRIIRLSALPLAMAGPLVLMGCVSVGDTTIAAPAAPAAASVGAPAANPELAALLARQPAGAYEVEPTHTSVHFRIDHWGLSMYTARFDKITGSINLNPTAPTSSSADITIDPASINTGITEFNTKLASDVFKSQPIRFVSTGMTATSATTGTMTGDLTMAGVTKPVTLSVQFNGGRPNPFAAGRQSIGFSARGSLKRSEWGSTQWSSGVGDTVEVIIEAEFLQPRT